MNTALETDLTVRAARHLRETCAIYRVDPPTVADIYEYASVAFDVLADEEAAELHGRRDGVSPSFTFNLDPRQWLDNYIDARERAAGDRCQSIFDRLDAYARLDDAVAHRVADISEAARFASCDPCVLVLVTHSGGAIVADISGGAVHEFDPLPRRRTPLAYLAGLFRGR